MLTIISISAAVLLALTATFIAGVKSSEVKTDQDE
jgi:hypothetical protein